MNDLHIELTTYANIKGFDIDPGKKFSVPFEWLEQFTIEEFNYTVEEFLNSYTWDNCEQVFEKAKEDKVIKLTKMQQSDLNFLKERLALEKKRLKDLLIFSKGVEHSSTMDAKRNIKRYESKIKEIENQYTFQ